jgi:Abi-like protein
MQAHSTPLKKALSESRFESYRLLPEDTEHDILARYLWNVQLSEALYPALSLLEVSLRNQLHHGLAALTASEAWYENMDTLSAAEYAEIQKAKSRTTRKALGARANCRRTKFWILDKPIPLILRAKTMAGPHHRRFPACTPVDTRAEKASEAPQWLSIAEKPNFSL